MNSSKKRPIIWTVVFGMFLITGLIVYLVYSLFLGSSMQERKSQVLEQIRDVSELATAEAVTKVIIEREDNKVFGQSIGINLPGTKRQLLVVIPGSVKAGIDLSQVTEEDFIIDEEEKTVLFRIPHADFLGGVNLDFERVDIYSSEGLFRSEATINEAYELAEEAVKLVQEEAKQQQVLERAEKNAERLIRELFQFEGYTVTIEYKE